MHNQLIALSAVMKKTGFEFSLKKSTALTSLFMYLCIRFVIIGLSIAAINLEGFVQVLFRQYYE